MLDIYIAIPYTYHSKLPGILGDNHVQQVKEARFNLATEYAAAATQCGALVYSPITHDHPMTAYGTGDTWEYWERMDTWYIKNSKQVHVICAEGWKESIGVQDEIAIAKRLGKRIRYIDPETWEEIDGH